MQLLHIRELMRWTVAANQMIPDSCLIVDVLVQSLFLNILFQLKVAALWTVWIVAAQKVRAVHFSIFNYMYFYFLVVQNFTRVPVDANKAKMIAI
jgi:hypothetical protein